MKRGQAQLVLQKIFLVAIFGIVLLSIIYGLYKIKNNDELEKQLYVTRLGLILQSLQAYGKDINAEIDIPNAGPYNLVFQGSEAAIKKGGIQTNLFIFTHAPGMLFTGGEFSPQNGTIGPLKLYKTGNRYGVAKPAEVPSMHLLNCDTPKGKPLKEIALDEGNSPALANSLKAGRPRFIPAEGTIAEKQQAKGDALISLQTTNINGVKAYYNSQEARRLACEILNEITKEHKIPVQLIPVNTDLLMPAEQKQILKGKRPAVLIETGIKDISFQIYKGMENYGLE